MTDWLKAKLGRMRVSTVVLIAVFIAFFWVHQTFEPQRAATQQPAVVPPGFVPDPNYTWVPQTDVRRPKEPVMTTTPTTTTTTTSPTATTSPTSPTESTPSTTVVDPDGAGPLPPQTITPTTAPLTPPTTPGVDLGPTPTTTPAG